MREVEQEPPVAEDAMQQLRSKAAELLLTEEWQESVQVYSQFINLCQAELLRTSNEADHVSKLHKSLCLAFSNRAEARFRLRDFNEALQDCEQALRIETTHFKALLCKEKCKKLECQSRTGAFDFSDWVLSGFRGKCPELGEYVGAVQIKKSEISGRGLFATKNIDAGTLVLVTKAIASERGILSGGGDSSERAQLVMWKNFIDKIVECTSKCRRTRHLISTLSSGENEDELKVPDISLFRPEMEESECSNKKLDMDRILNILDVNSLVEEAVSAKVLGKNRGFHGVGLWLLASFINHSCHPNARRVHVGDFVVVHASRDVKAGEEITFAYFDMLSLLEKRKEMSQTWGFSCNCKRCKFEEGMSSKPELREIEMGLERGIDAGCAVYKLEENMKRWTVRGREKGYLRASIWSTYSEAYGSERLIKRWGRRIPAMEAVVDSVVEAVGSDERVLKVLMGGLKRSGCGVAEMERAMKFKRGLYGKVVKKQALKSLLEMDIC